MHGRLRPTNPICTFGGPEGRFEINNTARDSPAVIPTGLLRNDDSRRYLDLDSGNLDQDDECFESPKSNHIGFDRLNLEIKQHFEPAELLEKGCALRWKSFQSMGFEEKGTFSRSSS